MRISQRSVWAALLLCGGGALVAGLWWHSKHPALQANGTAPAQAPARDPRPMAVALDATKAWPERVKEIRALAQNISDEDMRRLLAHLSEPLPRTGRENALVAINEMMQQLRTMGHANAQYADALASLMCNNDADPVVRDYAAQHAIQWLIAGTAPATGDNPAGLPTTADRHLILESLGVVLQEDGIEKGTFWGTALNALRSMKERNPADETVNQFFAAAETPITQVAAGERPAHLGNRVAAIQTLPQLSDRAASLQLARKLAFDPAVEGSARLPAVAVLGQMGTPEDLASLKQLADTDRRYRFAARSAIARLNDTQAKTPH